MAGPKPLTARQAKAIPKILDSRTCEEGCHAAGISKACFYKWMQNETFRAEFERQRDRLVEAAMALLVQNIGKAVSVIVELLDHSDARLRRLSAKDLIEYYIRHKELADIEKRIEVIEDGLGHANGGSRDPQFNCLG
jgi:hypothetical protein